MVSVTEFDMETNPQIPTLSGAQLLLLLREMGETDWISICHRLGINPESTPWLAPKNNAQYPRHTVMAVVVFSGA